MSICPSLLKSPRVVVAASDLSFTCANNTPKNPNTNPNNPATVGSLPGAGDEARINFGGNTVTVTSTEATVGSVKVGVDSTQ